MTLTHLERQAVLLVDPPGALGILHQPLAPEDVVKHWIAPALMLSDQLLHAIQDLCVVIILNRLIMKARPIKLYDPTRP